MIRVGSHSETLRPAYNGLNYDPNRMNDLVFNDVATLHTSVKTMKSLKCWSTNVDSLFNKLDELKARIYLFNPDIIAITEVYPKHSLYESTIVELSISGYDIFYNDISCGHHGVCIYIKSYIYFNAYLDDNLSSSRFSESVWCRILLGNVGRCIYQSPNNDVINFGHLCNLMNLALNTSALHVLVTGDFNMLHIDWTSRTVANQSSKDAEFLDLVDDLFLFEHVNFPTRVSEGQVPSLHDLVYLINQYSLIIYTLLK